MGTPFRHQGRVFQSGADCLGLVYATADAMGLISETWRPYARQPAEGQLEAALRGCQALREVRMVAPGDILVFRLARELQHLGIYTGRNIIHAWEPAGRVTEHRYCSKWERRKALAFRFRVFDEQ